MPDMFRLTGVEKVYFEAVQSAAAFVGADPSNLVMCTNLTTALNAVLKCLSLKTGEQGGNSNCFVCFTLYWIYSITIL